jgi:hypothetical protein
MRINVGAPGTSSPQNSQSEDCEFCCLKQKVSKLQKVTRKNKSEKSRPLSNQRPKSRLP